MEQNSIDNINWEEVRINAAINIMNAILSSSIMVFIFQFVFNRVYKENYSSRNTKLYMGNSNYFNSRYNSKIYTWNICKEKRTRCLILPINSTFFC